MVNEVRKTFVEWCREFRTPTKYEFWSMANTGLHISDVSPRGTASERISDVTAFNIQLKNMKYTLDEFSEAFFSAAKGVITVDDPKDFNDCILDIISEAKKKLVNKQVRYE